MQLQRDPQSQKKPLNLPNMEIIKDSRNMNKFKSVQDSSVMDWMPSYVKATTSRVRMRSCGCVY